MSTKEGTEDVAVEQGSKTLEEESESEIVNFAHLLPIASIRPSVSQWLAQDAPKFDIGGFVVGGEC